MFTRTYRHSVVWIIEFVSKCKADVDRTVSIVGICLFYAYISVPGLWRHRRRFGWKGFTIKYVNGYKLQMQLIDGYLENNTIQYIYIKYLFQDFKVFHHRLSYGHMFYWENIATWGFITA